MKENAEQRSVGVHEDLGIDPLLRGANQLNQKNPKPDDAPSKSSGLEVRLCRLYAAERMGRAGGARSQLLT